MKPVLLISRRLLLAKPTILYRIEVRHDFKLKSHHVITQFGCLPDGEPKREVSFAIGCTAQLVAEKLRYY
jgi:hypothetical protein